MLMQLILFCFQKNSFWGNAGSTIIWKAIRANYWAWTLWKFFFLVLYYFLSCRSEYFCI
uniref:Candidate secreted effector n=1 Tax=Meloidogyne incognita TaxID=6306 RepID=A0A914KNA1_MELIC